MLGKTPPTCLYRPVLVSMEAAQGYHKMPYASMGSVRVFRGVLLSAKACS